MQAKCIDKAMSGASQPAYLWFREEVLRQDVHHLSWEQLILNNIQLRLTVQARIHSETPIRVDIHRIL